jgi:hypothetical protein
VGNASVRELEASEASEERGDRRQAPRGETGRRERREGRERGEREERGERSEESRVGSVRRERFLNGRLWNAVLAAKGGERRQERRIRGEQREMVVASTQVQGAVAWCSVYTAVQIKRVVAAKSQKRN